MDVVMNHSDEVIVMGQGETILVGTPDEVRADERVIEAYLGGGVAAESGTESGRITEGREGESDDAR